MPAYSTPAASPVAGADLLLRVKIIAIEGRADGTGISELRRLLGYPRDTFDRMPDDAFAELVKDSGPYLGTALMIARNPTLAREHIKQLQDAIEGARVALSLPKTFRIGVTR